MEMGYHEGGAEIAPVFHSHRGWHGYRDKNGTKVTIKDDDGRVIYSERTEEQMQKEGIRRMIDSIKDYERVW